MLKMYPIIPARIYVNIYIYLIMVNNYLYKEPDAGKLHVRILCGVSPVRGLSTRQI